MMADHSALERLASGKYLLVTTFRRDGRGVPTPVWVARDGDALGVWTVADSGKVKRIRNRADVLVSACDIRGNASGEQLEGRAELMTAQQTAHHRKLLARKYGLSGRLVLAASRIRRGRDGTVGIRITLT